MDGPVINHTGRRRCSWEYFAHFIPEVRRAYQRGSGRREGERLRAWWVSQGRCGGLFKWICVMACFYWVFPGEGFMRKSEICRCFNGDEWGLAARTTQKRIRYSPFCRIGAVSQPAFGMQFKRSKRWILFFKLRTGRQNLPWWLPWWCTHSGTQLPRKSGHLKT